MHKLFLVAAAVAGLTCIAGAAVAREGGGGGPPPDPSPPDPPKVANAHVQNEIVLRGVELDDLLRRAAGQPVPCEDGCKKPRSPDAIAEFVGNSCHIIGGFNFQRNYARDAAPEIARLAAALEAGCEQFDATTRQLGPFDDSEGWRSAAAEMQRALPPLIDPASVALLEVLK